MRLEAAYEDLDCQVFLATRDLSEGGAYLQAPDPPGPGRQARLTLELPGSPRMLRLPAVVVRTEESGGFAVRFSDTLSTTDREQLRDFVFASLGL